MSELFIPTYVFYFINAYTMEFLSKYREQIYAIMRIMVGLLFIQHGLQKTTAMLNGTLPANDAMMIIAAVIETIGAFLVIVGWQTRLAAFISSGEMAFAYFIGHASAGFLPVNNKGELAVLFCFVLLFIAAYGPGIWSVDKASRGLRR